MVALPSPRHEQEHTLFNLPGKLGLSDQTENDFSELDISNSNIHQCPLLNTQATVWFIFDDLMFPWVPNAEQHNLTCRPCFPIPPPQ